MKLLCLFLLSTCLYPQATSQVTTKVKNITHRLDSTSIVHDSTGHLIPYNTWSPLLTGGDYVIAGGPPGSPDSNYLVLRQVTRQEKERSAHIMPSRPSPNFPDGQLFDFSAKSLDGTSYTISQLKGKIVVLHISALNHFPETELPSYNEVIDSFGTSGKLVFLCITPVKTADTKKLLQGVSLQYPVIADQQPFLKTTGVHMYPQDIVLDKDGKVFYSSTGKGTSTVIWLEKKIRALLLVP